MNCCLSNPQIGRDPFSTDGSPTVTEPNHHHYLCHLCHLQNLTHSGVVGGGVSAFGPCSARPFTARKIKRVSVSMLAPLTMLSISQSIFDARFPPLAKLVHGNLENVVAIE